MKTIVIIGEKTQEFESVKYAKSLLKDNYINLKCFVQKINDGELIRIYTKE